MDTDTEVQTVADLTVGLPANNLTLVGLARQLAQGIHHDAPAQADAAWVEKQRQQLREVVRFDPVTVTHAWPVTETHERGLQSRGYRFEFSNGLSAPGVLLESTVRPANGGTTLLISDSGRASMLVEAANDVGRGQRVLVLDPLLFGENIPGTGDDLSGLAQMINTVGARPLGWTRRRWLPLPAGCKRTRSMAVQRRASGSWRRATPHRCAWSRTAPAGKRSLSSPRQLCPSCTPRLRRATRSQAWAICLPTRLIIMTRKR